MNDGRWRVVGIGGMLREDSTNLGALRREFTAAKRPEAEAQVLRASA